MFHKAATNGKDNSKLIGKYLEHKKKKAEEKKKADEHKKQEEPPKPKVEAKVEPKVESKPEARTEAKPKVEAKPEVKNEPKPQPKKEQPQIQESQQKVAPPKNLISDKKKPEEDQKLKNEGGNDGGSIKMVSGTGMKLNKKIFVHDDIMNKENKVPKSQVSNVDLESIKTYVQEITKNANPIGKIIEFIGDDIDLMNKELQNWIKESKSYKERYDEEIK